MRERPRIWPHVVIEDGPSCAGIEAGDAISFRARNNVYLGGYYWAERIALHVWTTDAHYTDAACYRVDDDSGRVEYTENVGRTWHPVPRDRWRIKYGERHFRFVVDGPPLGSIKTFALRNGEKRRAVHCTEVGRSADAMIRAKLGIAEDDEQGQREHIIYSEWVLPENGATETMFVCERPSGEIAHVVLPRAIGIWAGAVQAYAETGVIDNEIAAGIARQLDDDRSDRLWVGWDGVVRSLDDKRIPESAWWKGFGRRALVYGRLTRRGDFSKIDFAEARRELADTAPASIAQISAVMHAIDPEAAAYEAALVEECGVLAG